ncbi:MAG: hypothetical protein CUN52_13885 [Phototrophicales bacterium]|nr:MAG: hypothetical protein CUN52_13885 [Phototrophicales bacterium]
MMKRIILTLSFVLILVITIAPASAKVITPDQSKLPVPLGFCVRATLPIGDMNFVDSLFGSSIWVTALSYVVWINGDAQGDTFELTLFINTDVAFDVASYDSGGSPYVFFNGLNADMSEFNGANIQVVDGQYCSIQAYKDNAALAQTYMVPNKGYDVYQIFQIDGRSQGILSFTVTIDDIMNAKAGDVLGKNEAGNIYFTYLGGGTCAVTYPYPDGKTNTKSFTCWK